MSPERTLKGKINKYNDEIQTLEANKAEIEAKLIEARTYVKAFKDALKYVSKGDTASSSTAAVRIGGDVDLTIKKLKSTNNPMHVVAILEALGKESTNKTRKALSAQLNAYQRQGRIFTRTAPNTFGLIEWSTAVKESDSEGEDPSEDPHAPSDRSDLLQSVG